MEKLRHYRGVDIHQKYVFGSRIGAGKFSTVYEGVRREDGRKVAIKDIENSRLSKTEMHSLMYETEIMEEFQSPYLIQHIETI